MRGLFLLAACGGHSSSRCAGLSVSRPLLLRSTSSRRASSVVVAHRPSCSAARGIFPDQGSNPCPRHWQADSTAPPGKPHLIYINALYHPKQILSDKRCLSPFTFLIVYSHGVCHPLWMWICQFQAEVNCSPQHQDGAISSPLGGALQ